MRRTAAEETIAALPTPTVTMYTDGSATSGTMNGGSGVEIKITESGDRIEISEPAGKLCTSYGAEMRAFWLAVTWAKENRHRLGLAQRIHIFSDSKSGLQRLDSGPTKQKDWIGARIWKVLSDPALADAKFLLHYVPAHTGLPGNEAADALANAGRAKDQRDIPIDHRTIISHHKANNEREMEEGTDTRSRESSWLLKQNMIWNSASRVSNDAHLLKFVQGAIALCCDPMLSALD